MIAIRGGCRNLLRTQCAELGDGDGDGDGDADGEEEGIAVVGFMLPLPHPAASAANEIPTTTPASWKTRQLFMMGGNSSR